jgi:hypothetical protein
MEGRGQGTTAAGEGRSAAARLIQRTWRAHVLRASFAWVRRRLVRAVGGGEGEPGLRTACSTSLQDHVERLTSPRTQRPHPRPTPHAPRPARISQERSLPWEILKSLSPLEHKLMQDCTM